MHKSEPKSEIKSLVEACKNGNIDVFHKLLKQGHSIHELSKEGKTLLSIACSAGYINIALILLKMNVDIESTGSHRDGCTPLMDASSSGFVEIVRLLLSYGAGVNTISNNGVTSLIFACRNGHVDIVMLLLSCGANIEIRASNGHTALMSAAYAGYVSIVKILVEKGVRISTYCRDYLESALTLASLRGHLEIVEILLNSESNQKKHVEYQVKPEEMFDALMNTAIDGHIEIAKILFKFNVEVNLTSSTFNSSETLLTLAINGGHIDLLLLFIDHGANLEDTNYKGYTALMQASVRGHDDIVFILLNKGAYINALSKHSSLSSLALACQSGSLYVADLLIRNGASLELGALTPLIKAAQIGNVVTVTLLLQCGANVHASSVFSDTSLLYACENGHTQVVHLLFMFGANLEHRSLDGYTPLMKACKAGHFSIVQFLTSQKSRMNKILHVSHKDNHTALSLACVGGHTSIIKYLLAFLITNFKEITDINALILLAAQGKHIDCVRQSILKLLLPNIDASLLSIIREQRVYFTELWNKDILAATSIFICNKLTKKHDVNKFRHKDLKDLMINSILNVIELKTKID